MLLFCWKSVKFTTYCQNVNLSRKWYFFKMHDFFSINMLLFFQKLEKFATNCWNISFSRGWYLINALFFCTNTLFYCKSSKFVTNCRNVNFLCKSYFLKCVIFCTIILLFRRKPTKLVTYCQNTVSLTAIIFKCMVSFA